MTAVLYTTAGVTLPGYDLEQVVSAGDMAIAEIFDPTGTPLGGTCTIDWGDGSAVFTDPGSSYIVFATHIYATPGDYTLVATWPGDGRSSVQHIVSVVPHLSVTMDNGLIGSPITFTAYGDYGYTNVFDVDWGDGSAPYSSTSAYGVTTPHTYLAAGDYTVTTTLTNARGTITYTRSVNVVDPPAGITIADAVELSGVSGSQVMGPYQGVPILSTAWPDYDPNTELALGSGCFLWARWTAPTDGVLVLTLTTDPDLEPNPWMTAYRASDMLALNEHEGPAVEPFSVGKMGVPVLAGVEYLFLVGTNHTSNETFLLEWRYNDRTVSGPCFFVPFGFHSDQLADAVQISDPTKTQTVAWAGGDYTNYVNTAYTNGDDRLYLSPDRLSYQPGHDTFGFGVVASGLWLSERPSVYFSDGLYPDSQCTERGAYPMGFPGTEDVLIIGGDYFYDEEWEFRRVSPDGTIVDRWSRPGNMPSRSGHPAESTAVLPSGGGPDAFVYYPDLQHGEFFDANNDPWFYLRATLYHWNGSNWVPDYSTAHDEVVGRVTLNGDGTSTLHPQSVGPYSAHFNRFHAFVQIGEEWLTCFNSATYQYNGGMWIRRYDSSWNILEEFEFRPWPVVLHGTTGDDADSVPPFAYGEFYAQGYMAVVPGDDEFFYMTNNAWEHGPGDVSWSFVFKIPRLDVGGSRFAAMREPWAAWKSNGGEIYNIVYGTMPAAAGGWSVGRVN